MRKASEVFSKETRALRSARHSALRSARRSRAKNSRAQAAIFDGITFLLMVGFSSALVYSVVSGYGDSMDNALYSFYELNYLQSAVKSLYYINLQELREINAKADPSYVGDDPAYLTDPALNGPGGCSRFADYTGSVTVLDLVKKDLSDKPNEPFFEGVRFDDSFWSRDSSKGVAAPGKQALRCALKETLKPLVLAGYDYYAEIVNPSNNSAIAVDKARVTSNASMSDPSQIANFVNEQGSGCLYAQSPEGGSHKALSMDVPLRISLGTACTPGPCQRNYVLRICVWQRY